MNNNFNGLDLSYSLDLVSSVQKQMKESERVAQRVAEEAYNERLKMQKAIEQTAANTAETNIHLQKVVENQNAYIDLLKDQIAAQKQQLDFAEQQIGILNNIFASDEDGVIVEKEILKLKSFITVAVKNGDSRERIIKSAISAARHRSWIFFFLNKKVKFLIFHNYHYHSISAWSIPQYRIYH